jgi:hypothetical protein
VLKQGASADEAELQRFVKDRLAPYKYPRAIVFIAELPKTATGKIQRFRLREHEQAAAIKGQFTVPDDFDTMGQEEIEKLFYGDEGSSLKPPK